MKNNNQGQIMKFYRLMRWLYTHRLSFMASIIYRIIQLLFNCTIPKTVELGNNCRVTHAVGIVLHQETQMGSGCIICQNVSIANSKVIIGNNVFLGAGCVILGPCHIGDNVKIGALTLVNFDVPSNCTVVGGAKGHIIKKDEDK